MKIEIECDYCGKKFLRERKLYNRGLKHNSKISCSKRCQNLLQKNGFNVNCNHCKKSIYVKKNIYENSISKTFYCNHKCAATENNKGRVQTEETKQKIRERLKNNNQISWFKIKSKQEIDEIIQKIKAVKLKQLLERNWDEIGYDTKIKRVKIEQQGKCKKCGLSKWQNQDIILEIEHKNGNHNNNNRDNLEALCPNCHSMTGTWRGRNKKGHRQKVIKDEILVRTYLKSENIRQCLIALGLAPKGANYGRVKRALTLYDVKY